MHEWINVTKGFTILTCSGLMFIQPLFQILIYTRIYEDPFLIFIYFTLISTTDSFAYIFGKTLQGPKLCSISPNKTWSGLVLGCMSCGLMLLFLNSIHYAYNYNISNILISPNNNRNFIYGCCFGILAQCSDLLMSFFKRKMNVKDYGNIIPGHGGVLDRFDGLILTWPILIIKN